MPLPVQPRMDVKSYLSFLVFAVAGCSAATSTTTPNPKPTTPAPGQTSNADRKPQLEVFCDTAACWQTRADQAAAKGITDVAAAYLGLAFARQPNLAAFTVWLDVLHASGQFRAAHAAAAASEKLPPRDRATLKARLAALPNLSPQTRLEPDSRLPEAWLALATGDLQGATALYQHVTARTSEPYHLARLAELEARAGATAKARQTWAAARIQADERGAAMRLEPADKWSTQGAVWVGKHLLLSRSFDTRDYGLQIPATRMEFWRPNHPEGPDFSYVLAGQTGTILLSDDGQHLVRTSGKTITIHDVFSGQEVASIPVAERLGPLSTIGKNAQARLLAAVGRNVELHNFTGKKLAQYTLKGTTPTITRVYRAGRGTHHDNILRDSPTWPVALALTEDAGKVAIGGSDGKVRLFTRDQKTEKLLEYTWKYEERRHRGGNPDLNVPLDMQFINGGKSLVVAYRHGDVITWNTSSGKKRKHLPGTCSVEEAATVVNMYNPKDKPQQVPTPEDREGCGDANTGRLSRDAKLVVTAGSGLRIRDLTKGTSQAMIVRGDGTLIPDDMLVFANDGTLALVDIYGRPEFWRGGNKLEKMFSKEAQTGPLSPEVTNLGQRLKFDLGRDSIIWDLKNGEKIDTKLAPKETLAALSPDARLAVVRTAGTGELRNLQDRVTITSWANLGNMVTARFSGAGTHVVVDRGWKAERRILIRDLKAGTEVELETPIVGDMPVVSDRGEALVSSNRNNGHIQIWNPTTGSLEQTIDAPDLRTIALAPDGSFLVWVAGAKDPKATVNFLALKGKTSPPPLVVDGWPKRQCLVVSPDSREVFVCTEGTLARWYPHEDRHITLPRSFVAPDRVSYSATGDLLFLGGFGRVDIHRNTPKLEEVGTVYPLLDGGWLAMSHAGAVDGSQHAHTSTVTFVVGSDWWIDVGLLAWDRFAVPGLYARMLAGEDVKPPVSALPAAALRPHEK